MKNSKKNKTSTKQKLSSSYLFESIGSSSRYFVFGLNWFVVLGEDLDKEAYKLARKSGADFYLRGGGRSNTVGLLKTNKANGYPDRGSELHSIASVFARSNPNNAFAVRFNTPKGVWFMAAHDGLVQEGTDCFYDSIEEVDEIISGFKQNWLSFTVYGDQPGDEKIPDLGDLLPQAGLYSRLKRASVSLQSIPKWAWVLLAVGMGYFAYGYGMEKWRVYQLEKQRLQQRLLHIDPVIGWRKAINDWAKHTPTLGYTGIDQWGAALGSVPTYIGRWQLDSFNCTTKGECSGDYVRMPLGSLDSFELHKPYGWDHQPQGLNVMSVSFDLPLELSSVQELGLTDLPKLSESKKKELNLFQEIIPLVNKIDFTKADKVQVTPPKQEQADGFFMPIPYPSGGHDLVYPYVSSFEVSMPLRGLLALDWGPYYAIKSLQVTQSRGGSSSKSGLLELNITGEYYVQE